MKNLFTMLFVAGIGQLELSQQEQKLTKQLQIKTNRETAKVKQFIYRSP